MRLGLCVGLSAFIITSVVTVYTRPHCISFLVGLNEHNDLTRFRDGGGDFYDTYVEMLAPSVFRPSRNVSNHHVTRTTDIKMARNLMIIIIIIIIIDIFFTHNTYNYDN